MIEKIQTTSLQFAQQIIFFVTERITIACLKLDPATRARLQTIAGKTVAIHIKDSLPLHKDGIMIYVCPTVKGIDLSADSRISADASLSISARDLLLLLRNKLSEPNTVSMEGDYELLLTVLDIVRGFNIDWEGAMAPMTGDVIAHHVGKNMRATEKWLTQSFREAKRLTEEYINEELPVARQSGPLKPFFDNMGKMKAAGDAMREKLAEKASNSPFFKPKK